MSKNVGPFLAGVGMAPMSLFPTLLKPVSLCISASSPTREGISRESCQTCLRWCRLGDEWIFETEERAGNVRKVGLRSSSLGNLVFETDRGLLLESEAQGESESKLGSLVIEDAAVDLERAFVLLRVLSCRLTIRARVILFVHSWSLLALSNGPKETAFIAGLAISTQQSFNGD